CGSESISRILGALARWPRWNPEPPRSRRSARQKSLRSAAGRTRADRERARFTPRRDRSAPGRSFLPAPGRRLQRRLHRELDRHETKRIRRAPATAAPVRVLDVLRRVIFNARLVAQTVAGEHGSTLAKQNYACFILATAANHELSANQTFTDGFQFASGESRKALKNPIPKSRCFGLCSSFFPRTSILAH